MRGVRFGRHWAVPEDFDHFRLEEGRADPARRRISSAVARDTFLRWARE